MTIEYFNYDFNDSNQCKLLREIKALIQQSIYIKGSKSSKLCLWLVENKIFYKSIITANQFNECKEILVAYGEINNINISDFNSILRNKDILHRFFTKTAKQNMIRISFSVFIKTEKKIIISIN